ncbi:hypothetical protein EX30DRAFT_365872 [Ascodesmis nigricans]|uniref:MARVEL domain-containing protein n=1 Tax=Ascodesmis nigricans TaxID=341454 RepID=A0A4S2MNB3_9PEZI|nr:hypothetical protein EX30DRAFT_365872 [Ascodesmis nigricans]
MPKFPRRIGDPRYDQHRLFFQLCYAMLVISSLIMIGTSAPGLASERVCLGDDGEFYMWSHFIFGFSLWGLLNALLDMILYTRCLTHPIYLIVMTSLSVPFWVSWLAVMGSLFHVLHRGIGWYTGAGGASYCNNTPRLWVAMMVFMVVGYLGVMVVAVKTFMAVKKERERLKLQGVCWHCGRGGEQEMT